MTEWTKPEILAYARAHGETRERPGMTWYVIRTNPRCENRVELRLLEAGLCTYQPEGLIWSKPRRATEEVARLRKAAARYVFIADPERSEPRWYDIRRCDGVHSALGVLGRPIGLPASEINRLRKDEAKGKFNFNRPSLKKKGKWDKRIFAAGDHVNILSGPFASFSGVASKASDAYSVGVELMIMGRMVPMDVALEMVDIPRENFRDAA